MIRIYKQWAVGLMMAVLLVMPHHVVRAVSINDIAKQIDALAAQIDAIKRLFEQTTTSSTGVFVGNLQYGMRNDRNVLRLQQFLIDNGYLKNGMATGNFLQGTRAALKAFQRERGLTATGSFNAATRTAINRLIAEAVKQAAPQRNESATSTLIVKKATTTPLIATASGTTTDQAIATSAGYRLEPRPAYDTAQLERATFDAVNAQRVANGLGPLVWDDRIASVARAHSIDQSSDNTVITNPNKPCLYPFIRHEGFVAGLHVGDRLDSANIPYRLAGENIIILPVTKNLMYRAEQAAPACVDMPTVEGSASETIDQARARIANDLAQRLALMQGQPDLNWVNREWKTTDGVAAESAIDWMQSPGHRQNILTPQFVKTGIGAAFVNDYLIMTQAFVN